MKTKEFSELTTAEQFEVVCSIKPLKENLGSYVFESEINDYVMDKIHGLRNVDYCIATYEPSFLHLDSYATDYDRYDFLVSLSETVKHFGCSDRIESQITKCFKLAKCNSNLFAYEIDRLCEMYFEDDIKPSIDYVVDCSYAIYCGKYNENLDSVWECWLDNMDYLLQNITQDEDGEWEYTEVRHYRAA